ncbi:precorrin-2 C(20)-methyltransferase [uncultured Methanobrevibacter sp.]|uniref:precorrin-2 C(20)-methyltransferase n=1 Tax=uncultured Methanobrevibacter sp. TaxID=253161 RepID=UPI00260C259D|nr:precorrin-2 C(20)-methyltransferase [uncultured Methanobrevibacter sp.]
MAEKGKLYGIGVGPGDTELLTLKAARILKTVPVIFTPKSSKEKESIALSIVKPVLEERDDYKRLMLVTPIFPMIEDKDELEKIWTSASEMIAQYLNSGRDVAFITLGDPSVFSTYAYVQKKLIDEYEIETVPGITSFTACAAARNKALVEQNQILTIVPKIDDRVEQVLEYSDSVVLMKASRNTSQLESTIEEKNRPKEIYSVQNCTRENEKIIEGFSNEKPYLTTTIIKFENDQ